MKFSIKDIFTFTEKILNGKLHFLYSEKVQRLLEGGSYSRSVPYYRKYGIKI